ncbi:hypothetical protein ASE70_10530 [Sphingomonas sp. Leaf22]|uniref:DUF2306 domain-containing protein n=1 Tax=Sphingomonas sp. Leaf22 TaxID=1735687 RepID=UPI0006FEF1B5|nr:DUF2306 domain-containing protein [Sphingomonas sp. Leaf22]KQM75799.1 hypothetical protein ASE70_10530 [Sphingomonas sp. Leaf22]
MGTTGQYAVRWAATLLVVVTWISAALFGAYIVAFFGGAALRGDPEQWNASLPALFDRAGPVGTVAIGAHFVAGGVLLLLGPIQLIGRLRAAWPALHRWLGRVYVVAAAVTGAGGLGFIATRGTIGGIVMDVGFGLYGLLVVGAAVLAWQRAWSGRIAAHRAWAIRLFALVIGSWLYRMEYGLWFLTMGKAGHVSDFHGPFDAVMAFAFYLPNLLVAELFIRARRRPAHAALAIGAVVALIAASLFIVLATWVFVTRFWGPGFVSGVTGTPL